jgi:hypothetical protein
LFIGLAIYFLYSVDRSRLLNSLPEQDRFRLSQRIRSLRRATGWTLAGASLLLLYAGLVRHGELSSRIGTLLAITASDQALHTTVAVTGGILFLLGLLFLVKSRQRKQALGN